MDPGCWTKQTVRFMSLRYSDGVKAIEWKQAHAVGLSSPCLPELPEVLAYWNSPKVLRHAIIVNSDIVLPNRDPVTVFA